MPAALPLASSFTLPVIDTRRSHRQRARRGPPARHFGALCRVVERLQVDGCVADACDGCDAGFDDASTCEGRHQQEHFERLVSLADRLDADADAGSDVEKGTGSGHGADGFGHALRRSLCFSLQMHTQRVAAIGALIASVRQRPDDERIDLLELLEQQLIVGFGDSLPMPDAQRRRIHHLLHAAADRG